MYLIATRDVAEQRLVGHYGHNSKHSLAPIEWVGSLTERQRMVRQEVTNPLYSGRLELSLEKNRCK